MAQLPDIIDPIAQAIDEYHERLPREPRYHMGCSAVGHKCDRKVWLDFRGANPEKFPGRILRLFRRGHHEESWVIEDLKAIGLEIVSEQDGHQLGVSWGGHLRGSIDGLILSGVPGAPAAQHVLEIKTHNRRSFEDLLKRGVQQAKPVHYAQMQLYMRGRRVDRALYVSVCKDDDRLYSERVRLDRAFADALIERGQRLALEEGLPPAMPSGGPAWYECKFCPHHSFCWGEKLCRESHCRVCAHSTPQEDGGWRCERWGKDIPEEFQWKGCRSFCPRMSLVPWEVVEVSDGGLSATYRINGAPITIGKDGGTMAEALEVHDAR